MPHLGQPTRLGLESGTLASRAQVSALHFYRAQKIEKVHTGCYTKKVEITMQTIRIKII